MSSVTLGAATPPAFSERIWRINWGLVLVLTAIAGIGVLALYSAAGGRYEPWAAKHAIRYGAALGVLLIVALIHPKVWLVLAWPIYIGAMLLLMAVDVIGKTGMGAQRWLMLGPMQIQPSEIAKVAVILVLARYFHGLGHIAPVGIGNRQIIERRRIRRILLHQLRQFVDGALCVPHRKVVAGPRPELLPIRHSVNVGHRLLEILLR